MAIDVEQEIEDALASEFTKAIQEEVDTKVLVDLFQSMGWGETIYMNPTKLMDWDYTGLLKGGCWHKKDRSVWIFETEEDHTWFLLKWADEIAPTLDSTTWRLYGRT